MTPDELAAFRTLAAQLQQAGQMAALGLTAAQAALEMANRLLTHAMEKLGEPSSPPAP